MKTAKTIKSGMTEPRFRAWLEKQDNNRKFHYCDSNSCVFATFFRETTDISDARCVLGHVKSNSIGVWVEFTKFFNKVDRFMSTDMPSRSDIVTIGDLKRFVQFETVSFLFR